MQIDLRTELQPIKGHGIDLNHAGAMMLMGSCFADNIGQRLVQAMFDADVNPFGTSFNPLSIARQLDMLMCGTCLSEADLVYHQGMWHSMMHHSAFSSFDATRALESMNRRMALAAGRLPQLQALVITWGTAYVFADNATGQVVNNCHKLPSQSFSRRRVSVDEIVDAYVPLIERLATINPNVKIILTVSPVRHLADTLHGNQLSKSTLLLAADELAGRFQDRCIYFPSYEALVDDLRDYRFYADDMVHPSSMAVEYIYRLFLGSFCSDATVSTAAECERMSRRLAHRVMTDSDEQRRSFEQSTQSALKALIAKYPYLSRICSDCYPTITDTDK